MDAVDDRDESTSTLTPEALSGLHETIERAATGVRDPEAMQRACERMDRMRDETYRKHGRLDITLPSIRALRDGDDG
jgi:hypothetical protein